MNLLETMAQSSAERMLNSIVLGFGLALFAWLLLRLMARRSSGTRFAVWFSVLIAIALLPFFSFPGASPTLTSHPELLAPRSWAIYLFGVWAALAALGLSRVAYSWLRIRRLRQVCIPLATVNPELQASVDALCQITGRQPEIVVSGVARVPMAVGFFRPMIIVPKWAAQELSPSELKAILLHELAHLRRHDHWTNLIQKIVGALFFFHPAVWWIERQISLEREMACDDAALEQFSDPRGYAECLVAVAEKSFLQRGLTLVQAAVGRARQITRRVASILDAGPGRTGVSKPVLALVIGGCLLCLTIAQHAPRLIGFADENTSPAAAVSYGTYGVGTAKVIPAALHLDSGTGATGLGERSATKKPGKLDLHKRYLQKTNERRPALVRTKAALKPPTPMLVLTSVPQPVSPPQTYYFVIQSVQSDSTGMPVWNFCVWRVTIDSTGRAVQMGIVAKSI